MQKDGIMSKRKSICGDSYELLDLLKHIELCGSILLFMYWIFFDFQTTRKQSAYKTYPELFTAV